MLGPVFVFGSLGWDRFLSVERCVTNDFEYGVRFWD